MSMVIAVVMGVMYKGASNGELLIAHDGALPTKSPEDMRQFKAWTTGNAVVMGRKTFESIGHALPNRENYVVTSNPNYVAENCTVCPTLEAAISLAKLDSARSAEMSDLDVYVIGGGAVYTETIEKQLADVVKINAICEDVDYEPEVDDLWLPRMLLESKYRRYRNQEQLAEGRRMYTTMWKPKSALV